MDEDGRYDAPAVRVDGSETGVERIDRAERQPFALTRDSFQQRLDETLPNWLLRDVEATERRDGGDDHDGDRPSDPIVVAHRGEHRQADAGEQELGHGLNEDVDDDARGRERGGHAAQGQDACANYLPADLRYRQQRVCALAQKADEHAGPRART